LKANLAALAGVLSAGGVSLLFLKLVNIELGQALGLFAGAGTSTPSLQAAIASLGNDSPAIGYSVAYPLGVAGPILLISLAFGILKPVVTPPPATGLNLLEVALHRTDLLGRRVGELMVLLPAEVQVAAIRRENRNQPATPDTVLAASDVLLLVGPRTDLLEEARRVIGWEVSGSVVQDRRDLDYLRVFASHPGVIGQTLAKVALPGNRASIVIQVRRGDTDLLPRPELVLEYGDRVGVLAHRDDFARLRAFFGDSIRGTAELNYISIGLGMALGFLLGAIPIPLPGVGTVSPGLSGVLIVGLVFGAFRRTARITWAIPAPANIVLRNLGLTVFLAQVGLASGPKFVATVSETGFLLLGLSAIAVVALVAPIILIAYGVFRMSFDEVAGIVAGACGNPAILAYTNKLTPTEKPDIAYATIFPGMTIVKILLVCLASVLFAPS
jgi:putative transport protein